MISRSVYYGLGHNLQFLYSHLHLSRPTSKHSVLICCSRSAGVEEGVGRGKGGNRRYRGRVESYLRSRRTPKDKAAKSLVSRRKRKPGEPRLPADHRLYLLVFLFSLEGVDLNPLAIFGYPRNEMTKMPNKTNIQYLDEPMPRM